MVVKLIAQDWQTYVNITHNLGDICRYIISLTYWFVNNNTAIKFTSEIYDFRTQTIQLVIIN